MAFYEFYKASELATLLLMWQHIQMDDNKYAFFIQQSKTDFFHHGHTITIHSAAHPPALSECSNYMLSQSSNFRTIYQSSRLADLHH